MEAFLISEGSSSAVSTIKVGINIVSELWFVLLLVYTTDRPGARNLLRDAQGKLYRGMLTLWFSEASA